MTTLLRKTNHGRVSAPHAEAPPRPRGSTRRAASLSVPPQSRGEVTWPTCEMVGNGASEGVALFSRLVALPQEARNVFVHAHGTSGQRREVIG